MGVTEGGGVGGGSTLMSPDFFLILVLVFSSQNLFIWLEANSATHKKSFQFCFPRIVSILITPQF
jgi:hypothetical protein